MGILDDAKDLAQTAGRKAKEAAADLGDRVHDTFDEVKAESNDQNLWMVLGGVT